HAFSLRDGWGRLLEKQGVVQESSREARAPMAGEPRPTILGERHGARHRGLRSGRGTGPSAKRRACLGERREVAPPGGPESVGMGSRGEGRRRSISFGCGCGIFGTGRSGRLRRKCAVNLDEASMKSYTPPEPVPGRHGAVALYKNVVRARERRVATTV